MYVGVGWVGACLRVRRLCAIYMLCVLGGQVSLSDPQFPRLSNGDNGRGWQKEETELICLKGPETCVLVVSGAECSFPSLTSHTIPPSAPIVPTLTESAPAPSSSWHGPGPAALQAPSHTWRPSFQSPVASAPALPAAGPSLPDTWGQKEERKKGSTFD